MLKRVRRPGRGFTIIELLIGVAVLGIVIAMGLPSMTTWIRNTQVRNVADSMMSGLQLARSEALRRNATVMFQITNDLSATCALSSSGLNWVVSIDDTSGHCDAAASETLPPRMVQKWSGVTESRSDGGASAPKAVVATTGGAAVQFNGLGRVVTPGNMTQIDISNPVGGACQDTSGGGTIRCLRVIMSTSGQARMCDPAVGNTADPRYC